MILKDMHKGVIHKGKIPSRALRAQEYQNQLKSLHASLQSAVQAENYEQARRCATRSRIWRCS